ncbi:PRC-barrel domain containing protein [Halosimplex marinum]|uniref:PRC-barrel domain containing protein n=1 Tax=Halosimplex marinum TaxID=3396620 RepID=UPI003F55291A
MTPDIEVTDADEGKTVVGPNGDEFGRVAEVRHGTAYVDPDPSMADAIMSKLGWGDSDEDTYPLQEERIESVTDDEIRLGDL